MKFLITVFFLFSLQVIASDIDWNDCKYCHDTKVKGSAHGGIAHECNLCHVSHFDKNKNEDNLIEDTVNKVCLNCHENISYGMGKGHPINFHPTEGGDDPVHPEKKYSCASCHNPHGSENTNLHRYFERDEVGSYYYCGVCHPKHIKDKFPNGIPRPPWE